MTGQDVDPFVPVVGSRLCIDLAGRDNDLPGLHAVGLHSEGNDGPALDVARFEADSWVADFRSANKIVQWHAVGVGQRKEQFQRGAPMAGF